MYDSKGKWQDQKNHKCTNNHEGISKDVNAYTCLILVKRLDEDKGVVLKKFVADDDSTMKSVVLHSRKNRVSRKYFPSFVHPTNIDSKKKRDTGILELHNPDPSYLVGTTHITKVAEERFLVTEEGKIFLNDNKSGLPMHQMILWAFF